jgi:hypothetical protein
MARHFTLEEARALLPAVTPILEEIVAIGGRLEKADRGQIEREWKARTNGHARPADSSTPAQATRAELIAKINAHIARLLELGIELKDLSIGLIDFRSYRDGRVVYLCWKLGEPTVAYWHDLDTGFAGRRPL